MVRRKGRKISFWATKSVKDSISFTTKSGKRVTFYAKRKIKESVPYILTIFLVVALISVIVLLGGKLLKEQAEAFKRVEGQCRETCKDGNMKFEGIGIDDGLFEATVYCICKNGTQKVEFPLKG